MQSTRKMGRLLRNGRVGAGVGTVIGVVLGTICACATPPAARAPSALALGRFTPLPPPPEKKGKLTGAARQLDELYAARFAAAGATSAVVGIVMDGELVYQAGFGALDTSGAARPDADTLFRIGSLSKSFAATAILKLRDEGKLALDDLAERYVPDVAKVRGAAKGSPPITIRQLLTMTSGLAYDDTWGPVSYGYDHRQLSRFFDEGVTLASPPGERMAYSNLGYALLGLVIERVSGQTFREYVTRNVLEPLGMSRTGWAPQAGMAVGYHRKGDQLVPEPHPDDGVFAPAGGLYSPLHDFARYVSFQLAAYAGAEAPDVAPLSRSSVREMHRGYAWMRWGHDAPVAKHEATRGLSLMASSYGFGWVNNTTCDYEGLVQHGGYEPGYFAYVRLLPRHGLGVVTFSATAAIGDYETFRRTLDVLRARGLLAPGEAVTPALRQAQLSVNRLLARWDDELGRATFDPDSLQYSWFAGIGADLQKLAGDHGSCKPEGELAASSATHASWRMRCDRGAIDFSLWLNPATRPRVQRLSWRELPAPGEDEDASFELPPPAAPNAPCQDVDARH